MIGASSSGDRNEHPFSVGIGLQAPEIPTRVGSRGAPEQHVATRCGVLVSLRAPRARQAPRSARSGGPALLRPSSRPGPEQPGSKQQGSQSGHAARDAGLFARIAAVAHHEVVRREQVLVRQMRPERAR
jgi:hypothetical protein